MSCVPIMFPYVPIMFPCELSRGRALKYTRLQMSMISFASPKHIADKGQARWR